ncbi:hypothetical protein sos41_14410 [Alphaproteobacteria bacterium SO-S41]|nr:hypothetical protein sos41_14410 [Alphaproteobacteria bacterium SO-S41]
MSRALNFATGFAGLFVHSLVGKVKHWWLIIGLAGVAIGGYNMGSQIHSSFIYEPAVATIMQAGWLCAERPGGPLKACSEARAAQLRNAKSGLDSEYRVTFRFDDKQHVTHIVTSYITRTGLPKEEALPGVTFDLLYDPANPKKTDLPFGTDYHSGLIGLVGLAALGSYVAMFWPWGRSRRRPGAVAAEIASRTLPSSGSFGRRQKSAQ